MVDRLAVVFFSTLVVGCAAGPIENRTDAAADGTGFVVVGDSGAGVSCRGNRDGVITRDEVVFVPGAEVRYRVNPANTLARVDPRGADGPGGTRRWDFTDPTGEMVSLRLERAQGQWFAGAFPTAEYAARIDVRSAPLGVYRATAEAVELLGVVGARAEDGTRVPYNVPLAILRFPLRVGAQWRAEAMTVDAELNHSPVASRDRYEITVDARGELRVPAITFPDALRVRVEVTQSFPAGPGTRRTQLLWLVECYGEVARAVSRDGELDAEFREATEFRRLAF